MARRRTQDRRTKDDDANSDVSDDVGRTHVGQKSNGRRTEVERTSDGSRTDVGRKSNGSRTEVERKCDDVSNDVDSDVSDDIGKTQDGRRTDVERKSDVRMMTPAMTSVVTSAMTQNSPPKIGRKSDENPTKSDEKRTCR